MSASYVYNSLETRVSKLENGVSNTFVRDGDYVTDPVLRDGAAAYTPGISERRGTVSTYLHGGLKNSVTQGAAGGTLSATRTYDAFGNVTASTGTWRGPFGYAGAFGYQEDQTGLRLLGHRYYDSSTGRFLTRDPIKDGRNWYGYGAGEAAPTLIADPWGLSYIVIGGSWGWGKPGGYAGGGHSIYIDFPGIGGGSWDVGRITERSTGVGIGIGGGATLDWGINPGSPKPGYGQSTFNKVSGRYKIVKGELNLEYSADGVAGGTGGELPKPGRKIGPGIGGGYFKGIKDTTTVSWSDWLKRMEVSTLAEGIGRLLR